MIRQKLKFLIVDKETYADNAYGKSLRNDQNAFNNNKFRWRKADRYDLIDLMRFGAVGGDADGSRATSILV